MFIYCQYFLLEYKLHDILVTLSILFFAGPKYLAEVLAHIAVQ